MTSASLLQKRERSSRLSFAIYATFTSVIALLSRPMSKHGREEPE